MTDSEFTKIISDLVISFEKAGVYDATLKTTIDRLFELKDVIYLRDALKHVPHCRICRHYEDRYCKNISAEKISDSEVEIVGQTPVNGRIRLKVNPYWSCSHFKK